MIHHTITEERHKRVPYYNSFQPLVDLHEETKVEEKLENISKKLENLDITKTLEKEKNLYSCEDTLRVATFNINGLAGKADILLKWMKTSSVDICFIQETWTSPGQTRRYLGDAVVTCHEYARPSRGHAPYGMAMIRNTSTTNPEDFICVTEEDAEEGQIRQWLAVRYCSTTFVGCYFPPEAGENMIAGLERICETIDTYSSQIVLLGDFNARCKEWGDTTNNTQGITLRFFTNEHGFKRVQPSSGQWSFRTPRGKSIVDHFFVNDLVEDTLLHADIMDQEALGGSDHRPVVACFSLPKNTSRVTNNSPRSWNRWRLRDKLVRVDFSAWLTSRLHTVMEVITELISYGTQNPSMRQDVIDRCDILIQEWLEYGLRIFVGKTTRRPRDPPDFNTQHILELKEKMDVAYNSYHKSEDAFGKDSPQVSDAWTEVLSAKESYLKAIDERKADLFEESADVLQKMSASEILRVLLSIRSSKQKSAPLLSVDPESMNAYRHHFESQFSNTYEERPDLAKALPRTFRPTAKSLSSEEICTFDSIKKVIDALPSGKASGESGILAEVIKAAGDPLVVAYVQLFRVYFDWAIFPSSWRRARIHPIHKKGDPTVIANYRPISLLEVPRKVFEGVLLPHLSNMLEPLSIEKGGFRRGRGTYDLIATLNE